MHRHFGRGLLPCVLPVAARATCAACAAEATTVTPDVKIIECPRDAMQGLHDFVPTESKIRFLDALLRVGYDTIDCVSFVSPKAVPQMRDSAEVLKAIENRVLLPSTADGGSPRLDPTKSKLLAVVANVRGAVRAVQQPTLSCVGYPLSVSETFQHRNCNTDIAHSLLDIAEMQKTCEAVSKDLVVYISMAFGNPYREPYSPEAVCALVEKVVALGVQTVSLADTTGEGTAGSISALFKTLAAAKLQTPTGKAVELGVHLHSTAEDAVGKVEAALAEGCRRFDGAIAGMGGCPFAKNALVGNIPTETIIDTVEKGGLSHGLNREALDHARSVVHGVWGTTVKELVIATVIHDEKSFLDLCLRHFRKADTKSVGFLTVDQFNQSLQAAYVEIGERPISEERLRQKFQQIDLGHDGRITFDEYMVYVRGALRRRLAKYMAAHE